MAQLSKVLKVVCWAGSVPFPPVSLQRQVVWLTVAAGVHVFITGESLHCFLVGVQIKVIATSDLWLFIHAFNLFPSTPHPAPLQEEEEKRTLHRDIVHGRSITYLKRGLLPQLLRATYCQCYLALYNTSTYEYKCYTLSAY